MGYFHVGNDSRSDTLTNDQGKTIQIVAPTADTHAEKLDVVAPLYMGVDKEADKLIIAIDEAFLSRIDALEARQPQEVQAVNTTIETTVEKSMSDEDLAHIDEELRDLSASIDATQEFAQTAYDQMADAIDKLTTMHDEQAEKLAKAESDVATLCELVDAREVELQKLATKHSRLFAIVCGVALAMFVALMLR
jgi:chromosome segregation ATPase